MSLQRPINVYQSGAAEDVMLRNLDLFEAEQREHLAEDHDAGDDCRRSIRIQAGHVAPLFHGHLRQPIEDPAALGLVRAPASP